LTILLPSWIENEVPGAAKAARLISREKLRKDQRQRLERLTSERTKSAWYELERPIKKSKKKELSKEQLWEAQFELMSVAFRAADLPPIGQREIMLAKKEISDLASSDAKLARGLWTFGSDAQLVGLWSLYLKNRSCGPTSRFSSYPFVPFAVELGRLGDFLERAADLYKKEPIPPLRNVKASTAPSTIVIRLIADVCKRRLGTPMYSTVATLANASLGREDISDTTVRSSLRTLAKTEAPASF
jgi:hypothetical protein